MCLISSPSATLFALSLFFVAFQPAYVSYFKSIGNDTTVRHLLAACPRLKNPKDTSHLSASCKFLSRRHNIENTYPKATSHLQQYKIPDMINRKESYKNRQIVKNRKRIDKS